MTETEETIRICPACNQPIMTETMLKQLNEDRIKRRKQHTDAAKKWRQKKALEKKLSKDVKSLTKEDLDKIAEQINTEEKQ